jgi:hypothetical protein
MGMRCTLLAAMAARPPRRREWGPALQEQCRGGPIYASAGTFSGSGGPS